MSWYHKPKREPRRPSRTTGRIAEVARAMAEGDVTLLYTDGSAFIRPITPEEIGLKLGLTASYVRSIQTRIRAQLGWQAS